MVRSTEDEVHDVVEIFALARLSAGPISGSDRSSVKPMMLVSGERSS